MQPVFNVHAVPCVIIAAVLLLINAAAASAASFDCNRAQSNIEQQICSDPKISALDDELSLVYQNALKLVSDPAGLKKVQLKWMKEVRDVSDSPKAILAAYLARIEEVRLNAKVKKHLFARSAPPQDILGRYSNKEPLCFDTKRGSDEYDCNHPEVESYIDLKAGPGHSVSIKGELWFLNGHQCGPFKGVAEWVDGVLRMPQLGDPENRCVLLMRFRDGKIFTENPGSNCKQALLCGANGGFHSIELPKKKDDTIRIKPEGRTKISITRGKDRKVIDLKDDIPGCLNLYDPTMPGKGQVKISAGIKVIDTVFRDNVYYAVLLLTANSNCNVQGQCGAAEDHTLIWMKFGSDLKLQDRKTAKIEDCQAFVRVIGPHEDDPSQAIKMVNEILTVKFADDMDSSERVVSSLTYDRNAPEKGFSVSSTKIRESAK